MSEIQPLPEGKIHPLQERQRQWGRYLDGVRSTAVLPGGPFFFLFFLVLTEVLTMTVALIIGGAIALAAYVLIGVKYLHARKQYKAVTAELQAAKRHAQAIESEHMTFGLDQPSIFETSGGRHTDPQDAYDCRMCIFEAQRIAGQRREIEKRRREALGKSTKHVPSVSSMLEQVITEMIYRGTKALQEALPHGTGCQCPTCQEQRS